MIYIVVVNMLLFMDLQNKIALSSERKRTLSMSLDYYVLFSWFIKAKCQLHHLEDYFVGGILEIRF